MTTIFTINDVLSLSDGNKTVMWHSEFLRQECHPSMEWGHISFYS